MSEFFKLKIENEIRIFSYDNKFNDWIGLGWVAMNQGAQCR